jgi:hypothetical protein
MTDSQFVDDLISIEKQIWLVVSSPLKNISQLCWLFPIYVKIKTIPNHQSDNL